MGILQDFIAQNRLKCFLADRAGRERKAMLAAYREGTAVETAPADAVRKYQEHALRALLTKAAQLPFYQDLADRIGHPVSQATLDDLPYIPFLTKAILREQGSRLLLPGAAGVYENYSGGSTGIPTRFWQDEHYVAHLSAATRRANELAGGFPGARVAKLWGAPQDKRKIESLSGRFRLWLLNQRYYDTFDMGAERMVSYHDDLSRFQPDIIQAYASSAYLLARFLKSRGIQPAYPRVSIISSAEKLFPQMRALIEEVFRVPVFDRYGSREVPAMAAECGYHQGLHVYMAGHILETADPVTGVPVTGKPGEIVVTALHNYAMPFLRYRIGDMGVLDTSPCPCGRTSHRLREVTGRTSDNFVMSDGRIVHGEYFTHLFYGLEGVEQFQFVQHTPLRYTLQIVPTARYRAELGKSLERQVRSMIGAQADLSIEIREQIPKTASGKYRFTVSHVDAGELAGAGGVR